MGSKTASLLIGVRPIRVRHARRHILLHRPRQVGGGDPVVVEEIDRHADAELERNGSRCYYLQSRVSD